MGLMQDPTSVDCMVGRMRCLQALGRKTCVSDVVYVVWLCV